MGDYMREGHLRHPREGRRRQGAARAVRRRGLLRLLRRCWPRPSAVSSRAFLSITACCARTRAMRSRRRSASWDINFVRVNAEERFLAQARRRHPTRSSKRKIIGEEFIRVFEEEAQEDRHGRLSGAGHDLSRRDRIRRRQAPPSSRATTTSAVCRTMWISRRSSSRCACCSRTRCAQLGRELGLPEYLVDAPAVPGSGSWPSACIGEITEEKLDILRDADAIFRDEIAKAQA